MRCAAGNASTGPAIIERMGDSVVVPPGFRAVSIRLLTIRLGAGGRRRTAGRDGR